MDDRPRVLLLGDSIRVSYQPMVATMLADRAEVVGPADNCQFALYTLSSLDRWLAELGRPDIVHWNNGLHDVGHNPGRAPVQIPLGMYVADLRFILANLRAITPHVIWATMTPVHPDRPFTSDAWSWRNEAIAQYNTAAGELMATHGVPINDLHALVLPHVDEYLADDLIHLNDAGQRACAKAVAEIVRPYLG